MKKTKKSKDQPKKFKHGIADEEYVLIMSQSTYDYLVELTAQSFAVVLDEDDKEHKIPLDIAEDFPDGYVVLLDDEMEFIEAYQVDIPKSTGGIH